MLEHTVMQRNLVLPCEMLKGLFKPNWSYVLYVPLVARYE